MGVVLTMAQSAMSRIRVFLCDNLLILYSQSNMCRGVPQAGKENTEAVESSLHCNGNAVSLGLIGT